MNAARTRALAASFACGLVGMNFRNRHFVARFNHRSEIGVARDKVATKERLEPAGVAVAGTLAVIRRAAQIEAVYAELCARGGGFVVKPARSAQGRGILLCAGAAPVGVTKLSGAVLPWQAFEFHLHQILHGEFSFGRPDDTVLIEELLLPDADWILPGLPGAPDLRVILFDQQLVMSMARLPTSQSDGRANLHCGAVGIGVDLATGRTCGGVHRGRLVDRHPDTDGWLAGHLVADFDHCLEASKRCAEVFGLGYIGVDLMRDRARGPVVLEVNARPGLALQLANRRGLFSPPSSAL